MYKCVSVLEGARIRVVKRSDAHKKKLLKIDYLPHKLFQPFNNPKFHAFTHYSIFGM